MANHLIRNLLVTSLLLSPSPLAAAEQAAPDSPPWQYNAGANDDEGWGELSKDYATCTLGNNQSPVGIDYTTKSTMPLLNINYHSSAARMQLKEKTVVMTFKGKNTLTDQGHAYQLVQIRMHTPAEHSVSDRVYPLEIQLIHQDSKGAFLILSILAKVGNNGDQDLQPILDNFPNKSGAATELAFNPEKLLPLPKGYYAYTGSLSWPPCTENVEWRVFKQPVTISKPQLKVVADVLGRNARLLQPLYLRTIKETID
jgi:carbonic anhydrase